MIATAELTRSAPSRARGATRPAFLKNQNARALATAPPRARAVPAPASAAFVAFTALGMAVGPGVAACISALPEGEVAGLPLNNMTTPGYAMLLLWLPYFLVVACAFVEPPMHARQGALARARVKGNGPEASQPLLPRADSPAQRELQPHQPRRPPQYGAPSPLGRAPSPADGGARAAALKHQQQRLGSTSAWSEEQGESGQNANQMPLLEEELRAGDGRASDRAGAAAIASPAAAAAASPGKLRARLASLGAASKFGEGDSRPLLTIEGSARGRASGSQLLGVGVLLWLYLVDKLLAEAWLTSAPIVTRSVFGWGEQRVGIFLCTVCALVLPASQVATLLFAGVSAHTRERTIIRCAPRGHPRARPCTRWRAHVAAATAAPCPVIAVVSLGSVQDRCCKKGRWGQDAVSAMDGRLACERRAQGGAGRARSCGLQRAARC